MMSLKKADTISNSTRVFVRAEVPAGLSQGLKDQLTFLLINDLCGSVR